MKTIRWRDGSYKKIPNYYAKCGPGKRPLFAAFDFETDGLGGKILACSYMKEGDAEPSYIAGGDILQKIFTIMINNHGFTWYAHNVQYEWRYFIRKLEEHKKNIKIFPRTDSDIFMISLKLPDFSYINHKRNVIIPELIMRDSYAIFPQKLEKFAENFTPELPKLDRVKDRGSFDTVPFDPKNPYDIEYSKRDSETLLKCLIRFDDLLFENFGIHIRLTTASTAIAAWQRTLGKDERYYNSEKNEDFIRSSYYGGLVFLTDTNKYFGAKTFDINSSYPYQMLTHDMPIGNPTRTRTVSRRDLGIYRVRVRAPDNLIIPILPVRDSKGIIWPAGEFETTATGEEIIYATEKGYELLDVLEGFTWHRRAKPFDAVLRVCVELRTRYAGTALEIVAKLMQNSIYGKFGSKRLRRVFYAELPNGEYDGFEPWGEFFVRDEHTDDMKCLPQWAVFITARARLHLLRAAYDIGPENCLYGDTDSLTVKPGCDLPTGNAYGDWKLEKEWQSFRAAGAKIYAGEIIDKKSGELVMKGAAKGIPRKKWNERTMPDNLTVLESVYNDQAKTVHYLRLEKFAVSLKTDYIGTHEAHRSLSSLGKSRSWVLMADGTVRPRKFGEAGQGTFDFPERRGLPNIKSS